MSTISELFLVVLLLAANVLLLVCSTHRWVDIHRRAANLAVFNLIPLCTGLTFGLPTHLLGISRSSFAWMHRWFGRMAAVHSLLHGASIIAEADDALHTLGHHRIPLLVSTQLLKYPRTFKADGSNWAQATALLLSMVPVTLNAIVRRHSQIALKIHYILAITAMATLSYHTWYQQSSCRWYLAGAGILWAVLSMATGVHAIVMKRWGYAWPAVTLRPFHELLRLEITVPAHWTVQPGQWVYLWLPRASLRTCFQLPLLYVSFWDDTPKQRTLYILVRPQSATLYDRLYMEEPLHDCQHSALLLGPYGQCVDLTAFGTILFIVEDVAIMRVLPFIRMLVLASEQRQAMVRKLRIVWQMDDFGIVSPSTSPTLSTIEVLTASMPPNLARGLDAGSVRPRPW
jgi:hypothetical protein